MNAAHGHALVVGGSTGIGAATALRLLARGARVTVLSRRGLSPDLVARGGGSLGHVPCDAAKPGALAEAITVAAEADGAPTALVYAAGGATLGHTLAIPEADARASFEVNFWGLDAAVRAVLPGMVARRGGAIVAVLSLAAVRAVPHESYYAAAKAACLRYLQCLAHEVEPQGVRLGYVCPGYIPTGFLERARWFGMDVPTVKGSGVTADDVARVVVDVAEGKGRSRVIGWRERAITFADRMVPDLYDRVVLARRRTPAP